LYIELKNIFSIFSKIENNRIVLVKVLNQDGKNALIEVNGDRLNAKVESELPPSFFAYVLKNGNKINLKILENLNSVRLFKEKEVELIKDFIVSNSLPLIEENIDIVMKIIKNSIPLKIENFELLKYSLLRYKEIPTFLVELLKKGKKIDKDFIDIVVNFKEVLKKFVKKDIFLKNMDSITSENEKNIRELLLFMDFLDKIFERNLDIKFSFRRFDEEDVFIISKIEEKKGKKYIYFDFSSEEIKNFFVSIEIDKIELALSVYLDEELIISFEKEISSKKEEIEKRLKNYYSEKNIHVRFLSYNNNSIFENLFFAENKEKGIVNLDIVI